MCACVRDKKQDVCLCKGIAMPLDCLLKITHYSMGSRRGFGSCTGCDPLDQRN